MILTSQRKKIRVRLKVWSIIFFLFSNTNGIESHCEKVRGWTYITCAATTQFLSQTRFEELFAHSRQTLMIHLGIWHCVNVPQSLWQEAKSWTRRGVNLCFYTQWLKKTVMLKKWNELANDCVSPNINYRTVHVNIRPTVVVLSEFFIISALEWWFDSLS